MGNKNMEKEHKIKLPSFPVYYDFNLIAAVVLLVSFGLVMLYSTSSYIPDSRFFLKQVIFACGGFLIALVISKLDYHLFYYISPIIYLAAVALMVLVQSPLGVEVKGARRWLRLGPIQFQPSEFAKIAAITLMPALILKIGRRIKLLKGQFIVLLVAAFLSICVYKLTENLSTAVIVTGISLLIFFVAFPDVRRFLLSGIRILLVLAVIGMAVVLISGMISGEPVKLVEDYQMDRFLTWLHPEETADRGSYQVMQGLYAIGSGGFLGKGLGNSIQKLGAVPEAHNDMIFAIVCEELGVFGGVLLLGLFAYLLYRLFFIAVNAPDLYGSLMTVGIFAHISMQVVFNICVVLNLIPTTGVTLPFISYGGTSLIFLMTEMGMALSVSNQITEKNKKDVDKQE